MLFSIRLPIFALLSTITFLAFGCGEKTVVGTNTSKAENSERCIACHTVTSRVTGKYIADEWKLSGHNTKNGASCGDCHEPHLSHPEAGNCNRCHGGNPVSGSDVTVNEKCEKCHAKGGGFRESSTAHYNQKTSKDYPASYVSYMYSGNCRKCHNPHDTASSTKYLKNWAESAHGTTNTKPNINQYRINARDEYDFKTTGTFDKTAETALSDNYGDAFVEVCVRCHTTTGYINYVKSGFKDISPFGPNDPATGKPYQIKNSANVYGKYDKATRSNISSDKTRELTGCNVCHDDGNEVAYNFKKLRSVKQVTSYYNLAQKDGTPFPGGALTGFALTFPDVGKSNICVPCHSGRMTGINVKMADIRGINMDNTPKIVDHFRGGALLMFKPVARDGKQYGAGFEFYSSGSIKLQDYDNIKYAHKIIGLNQSRTYNEETEGPRAGYKADDPDKTEYGPCIGCHLNMKDELKNVQSSHTFLPVNTNAGSTYRDGATPSDPITKVVSKACANCHAHNAEARDFGLRSEWDDEDTPGLNNLELEKSRFKATLKAFKNLLAFAVDVRADKRVADDGEGRPGTPSNWYGNNADGKIRLQPWLRTKTSNGGNPEAPLEYLLDSRNQFTDPILGTSFQLRTASYNMGAVYNFFMAYYDPGAFAHNRYYIKRLMFDSMDWLDNGKLDKSVCEPGAIKKDSLSTYGGNGIQGGESQDVFKYSNVLTPDELKKAGYYICRNSKIGPDHRPNPYK